MGGSRWGTGGPDPSFLKNHKNTGFVSNTGLNPMEKHKATKHAKLAFNVRPLSARQRNATLNGVLLAIR